MDIIAQTDSKPWMSDLFFSTLFSSQFYIVESWLGLNFCCFLGMLSFPKQKHQTASSIAKCAWIAFLKFHNGKSLIFESIISNICFNQAVASFISKTTKFKWITLIRNSMQYRINHDMWTGNSAEEGNESIPFGRNLFLKQLQYIRYGTFFQLTVNKIFLQNRTGSTNGWTRRRVWIWSVPWYNIEN